MVISPEWFAAVGTVGTLGTALWQIRRERLARQGLERDRERRERRAQAERVSAWPTARLSAADQAIALLNGSDEPVYRAVVYVVFIQGAAPRTGREMEQHFRAQGGLDPRSLLSVIPPGRSYTSAQGGFGIMAGRPGVEVAFTDRAGVHWLRSSDGSLAEIDESAVDYYAIAGPHNWEIPSESPLQTR